MKQEVAVPQIGESVASGVLAAWLKHEGDTVQEGEELFELETDKATLSVPSPAAGVLSVQVAEGAEVTVGQVVALVDDDATATAAAITAAITTTPEPADATSTATEAATGLSPAVRRIVAEHGLDVTALQGSGPGGRITKADALAAATEAAGAKRADQTKPTTGVETTATAAKPAVAGAEAGAEADAGGANSGAQRRVKMSSLRRRIAENLVSSKQNAAHLSTFNEVDMSAVMAMRSRHKDRFAERHGVKLGFMSFFVTAAVRALQSYPEVNAFIDGDEILYNDFYNVGVALSSDRGLIVPVIRDADRKSFADIEAQILDFMEKARSKKLSPDELTGGTFTISNGGVFGSMLSTPIPSPPQTGVLGMHSIQKRPVVVDDQIVIRPMMYLALTYDHRIIDGREAVGFLGKIKQLIEDPTQMLLGL